ncbi:hypothetical protein XENORESO_002660 [Xenotaenia resolanae]|uniref:Uncharacterized protein n=1 Tax=Xenotaenia resolanae TaxID=208358 RepID=A0ABV0VNI1_9TELE
MNEAIRKDSQAVSGQMIFFPFYPKPERNPCDVCDLLTPSSEISQVDIIKRQEHLKAERAGRAWSPNQEKCFFLFTAKKVYRHMFKAHSYVFGKDSCLTLGM